MSEIPRAYEPGYIEKKWYSDWLEKGYFTPAIRPDKKPFVVIMPPPNVTGELHLGHALTATLEDIMVRWHRMKGEPALWLPGTDHAGIATQVVVEQQLAKQGLTRTAIGRERFTELAWEWAEQRRRDMREQHQMLGASCDWTRERFTLDEGPSRAVRTAFVRLYDKGLIYRGERIINWCPRCQTALSDLEVDHREVQGHLYHLRYPLSAREGFVTVATTRPETFFGDTAVAVNPDDERYSGLIGARVVLPLIGREIPIVADDAVEVSFGTGALKITPAHDPTDFEVGKRHALPLVDIMNSDATLNENAGPYQGLERFACRERVVADLQDRGLLSGIEPYVHSVGHCSRCRTMIEPRVSLQWFVHTGPLAEAAIRAVEQGSVVIIPERFTKTYFEWMRNIRDWCISRQLWWGHRIPVWYCPDCGTVMASVEEPSACSGCASEGIVQDPDVLDTWFSSGLWPHSALGWPEDTEDLRYFYPTSVMETGYDILFFWVSRMIMMGLEDTGEVPFHTVYLHGLLRDDTGEKMSKLRGNVINPAEAVDRYGVDALRYALTTGSSPGNDISLGSGRLESSRNFANKLWNASRFILRAAAGASESDAEALVGSTDLIRVEDRWIDSQLDRLVVDVNRLLEDFQFGEAEQQIYDFVWTKFCDWYIEIAKVRLRQRLLPSPLPRLLDTLDTTLRLLHPFMPFVTEELWQHLKAYLPDKDQKAASIVIDRYPLADGSRIDVEADRVMESVMEIVRSVRHARAQHRVEPGKRIEAQVYADELLPQLVALETIIEELAQVRPLSILGRGKRQPDDSKALTLVLREAEVVLPWAGMVDRAAERRRLAEETDEARARLVGLEERLSDQAFLSRAPSQVVEKERQKLVALQDRIRRLELELTELGS